MKQWNFKKCNPQSPFSSNFPFGSNLLYHMLSGILFKQVRLFVCERGLTTCTPRYLSIHKSQRLPPTLQPDSTAALKGSLVSCHFNVAVTRQQSWSNFFEAVFQRTAYIQPWAAAAHELKMTWIFYETDRLSRQIIIYSIHPPRPLFNELLAMY